MNGVVGNNFLVTQGDSALDCIIHGRTINIRHSDGRYLNSGGPNGELRLGAASEADFYEWNNNTREYVCTQNGDSVSLKSLSLNSFIDIGGSSAFALAATDSSESGADLTLVLNNPNFKLLDPRLNIDLFIAILSANY